MARDPGLEEVLAEDLAEVSGLTTRPMFGGMTWSYAGHLLCGVRHDGMLVRLGPSGEERAAENDGIIPMRAGTRAMPGWFRVAATAMAKDDLRRGLLDAALAFVRTLPGKVAPLPDVPWDFPDTPYPARSRSTRSSTSKV